MQLRSTIQQRLFALLYHQGSFGYDKLTDWFFLGEWTRWQETVFAYLPAQGTILELGCGTGRLARTASNAGWHWIALDRSAPMVTRARKQIGAAGPALIHADARQLPFVSASFDGVVATFPAPFIFTSATAHELRRVLRPGGVVVILISAELSGDDWPRRWRRALLDLFYGSGRPRSQPDHTFPGFKQETFERATAFGRAQLLLLQLDETGLIDASG